MYGRGDEGGERGRHCLEGVYECGRPREYLPVSELVPVDTVLLKGVMAADAWVGEVSAPEEEEEEEEGWLSGPWPDVGEARGPRVEPAPPARPTPPSPPPPPPPVFNPGRTGVVIFECSIAPVLLSRERPRNSITSWSMRRSLSRGFVFKAPRFTNMVSFSNSAPALLLPPGVIECAIECFRGCAIRCHRVIGCVSECASECVIGRVTG